FSLPAAKPEGGSTKSTHIARHAAVFRRLRGLVITVFVFLVVLVFVLILVQLVHRIQLKRVLGDHFKIRAALWTGNNFAFIEFFLIQIEVGIAFRANRHFFPPSDIVTKWQGPRDYI